MGADTLENTAGLGNRNHYGQRKVNERYAGEYPNSGAIKQAAVIVDIADVITGAPSTSNVLISAGGVSTYAMEAKIPAYSKILSCRAVVVEALTTTGGSAATSATLTVGLEQPDGTDIDLDGLIDATDGALTIASNDIAEPRGSYLQGGSAALVPDYGTAATPGETTSIGSAAGNLYALLTIDDVTGMTAAAGKVRILVEYLDERADGSGRYTAGGVKG